MHLLLPAARRTMLRAVPALVAAIMASLLAIALAFPSDAAPNRTVLRRTAPAGATCAIRHPLSVQIVALDEVRRGQVVRLRLTLSPERPVERGEIRLASAGDAIVTGARRAALRAISAGGRTEQEFAVRVPDAGARTLIQFVVEAEGAQGIVRRGATFNLLPGGPAEQPRVTRTAEGTTVSEVAARRLEP